MKCICLCLSLLSALYATAVPSAEPANIVLIMADDLGYETLRSNGGSSYQTPNLDRLAAEGVRFTHCYSQPLCTPSRVKLMTGMTNRRNYVQFGYLDIDQRSFAHDLQDAGYATAVVGKWQLNGDQAWPDKPPLVRPRLFGFDKWRLWQLADSGRVEQTIDGKTRRIDARYANPVLNTDGQQSDVLTGQYGPDLCVDYAVDFINQHRDQPFLLYYPMILTHGPFYPTPSTPAWKDADKRGRSGKTKSAYFGDMLKYADLLVGRIVQSLQRANIADNTWVMFIGDNGTDRSVISKMSDGRRIAGGKGQMNDRGNHVPMIVWRAGLKAPGRVSDALVDFSDFAPTLNEIAGTGKAEDSRFDGQSFLGAVTDSPQYRPRDSIYIWYTANKVGGNRQPAKAFARNQRYKRYDSGDFFDIKTDPDEQSSLSTDELTGDAREAYETLGDTLQRFEGIRPVLR